MGVQSYNEFEYKKQKYFGPSMLKQGTISQVYIQTWTADVQLLGTYQGILKNLPLASTIPSSIMKGDLCVVNIFDANNPQNSIVAYTYGRRAIPKSASGSTTVGTSGVAIEHGLGGVPSVISVFLGGSTLGTQSTNISVTQISSPFAVSQGSNNIPITDDVYQYQNADNTFIYLKSMVGNITVQWYAFIFQ